MAVAIIVIVVGVLIFAYFVFSNERRKRKSGAVPKAPKEKKVKEKKVKEPKKKIEKIDTDETPNYESLQALGNESETVAEDYRFGDSAPSRDSFNQSRGNSYFNKEMDQLFDKQNRDPRSSHKPFLSTYSNDDSATGGYKSSLPHDPSSGDHKKRRSIRDVKYDHTNISNNISPYSVGEEFGYDISDFSGKSESEIASMFANLSPEIRLMLVTNILNRKYD